MTEDKQSISILQRNLRILGQAGRLPGIIPISGDYDDTTRQAVRHFQRTVRLPITGETNLATWDAAAAAAEGVQLGLSEGIPIQIFPNSQFRMGMGDSGRLVLLMQALLNGLPPHFASQPLVPYSGEYGEETAAAVSALQHALRLPVNGVIDRAVWDGLAQVYSAYARFPAAEGQSAPQE